MIATDEKHQDSLHRELSTISKRHMRYLSIISGLKARKTQQFFTAPLAKRGYQALHFGPPVGLVRSTIAVLHGHQQPEDQAQPVVG
jgi:hypothetical protein